MESTASALQKIYRVYAALMGLLAITACAVAVPPNRWLIAISLGIAAIKGFLIFAHFMKLKTASGLTRVFACVGFAWLAIALCLVLADYATRT